MKSSNKGMVSTILSNVKEYKASSIATPIFMLGEVIVENFIPFLAAGIIDSIYSKDLKNVGIMATVMLLLAVAGLIFGYLGGVYAAKASAGLAKNLRFTMFNKIGDYSFSNIDKFSTAGLVTRLTTDVMNIQNAYQMILRMLVRAPFTLIVAMTMAFFKSAKIARIYLIAVIILGFFIFLIAKSAFKYFGQVFSKYDDLNASVQENVTGMRVVKAFVREDYEKKKFSLASKNIYKMFIKAEGIVNFNAPLMNLTVYTCIILVSWLGAHEIVNSHNNVALGLTTGNLSALLTYCVNILMSLMMLSFVMVMITMSLSSAKRIAEVINEKPDIVNPKNAVMNVENGDVEFKNVSFRYNKNSEEPVLSDINLSIKSGEVIGIMGGTGSAKSSLVNLISRLYDVEDGEVRVGGINVKDYDLEVLRNQVSVVLQNNVLFSGSIKDNIRWGDENASDEEIKRVCELACASEFIDKMPDGYDTYITQGGSNVSGGQKQRLCIARALLKKPKILILDDSTSAVDTITDASIRNAFKTEIPDTTKIIIAQRISSLQDSDKIIVLDDGKISGIGTHEELLKNNEIYSEIYRQQTVESADFDKEGGNN